MRVLTRGTAIAFATLASLGANAADLSYPPPVVGQPQYGLAEPTVAPPQVTSSFQAQRPPHSIPACQFHRRWLGLTRMVLHRQSLQGPMLCHPQTARQFGAAVCAVVLGSQAAYRRNIILTSTTRPASVTLIHGRPAPRCTSLPMRFHLRTTIPVHTHERSTRVQLSIFAVTVIYLLGILGCGKRLCASVDA